MSRSSLPFVRAHLASSGVVPNYASWSSLPGSVAGNVLRVARWDGRAVVVKVADKGAVAVEGAALEAVGPAPGVARLVAYDTEVGYLCTEFVSSVPGAGWDGESFVSAVSVLDQVSSRLGSSSVELLPYSQRFPDEVDYPRAVTLLSRIMDPVAAYAVADARTRLYEAVVLVPSHGDVHPGNWVFGDCGPVLVDFASVALVPPRLDAAVLLSLIDAPVADRLVWAAEVGLSRSDLVAALAHAGPGVGSGLRSGPSSWRAWCELSAPPLRSLAVAIF